MKCSQCGVCCALFLINLSEKEYRSKRYKTMFPGFVKDFDEACQIGANILAQKEDNNCIYLKNKKCSIHQRRPSVCRKFFCKSKDKKYKEMIKEIKVQIKKRELPTSTPRLFQEISG